MKIKSILSALLLMVSSVASAQYLNVKLEDGTYRSYKTTPNMKVSFGKKAGADVTESEQIVTINGYSVTVKLAEGIPASDVMVSAYSEGEIVKIKAVSADGYGLDCSRDDNVEVSASDVSNGFHTFTLSNIQKDVVVTIGYITVKFDMNGHGESIQDAKVAYGKTVTAPSTPKAANYAFWCWCTDAKCTTLYDFSKGVTADLTLYAKWTGSIKGHAYVELAGYKWATENVGYCSDVTATAGPSSSNNGWGFYFYNQSKASGAAQSWGSETDASQVTHKWTLPSESIWQELIKQCYWEWTGSYNYLNSPYNGKSGYIVYEARDGDKGGLNQENSGYTPATVPHIFLPAAGVHYETDRRVYGQSELGYYWSSNERMYLHTLNSDRFMNDSSPTMAGPCALSQSDCARRTQCQI